MRGNEYHEVEKRDKKGLNNWAEIAQGPQYHNPDIEGGEVFFYFDKTQLLAAAEVTILAGRPKTGKTRILQAMSRQFLKGGAGLLNMRVPWDAGRNKVIYLDFDQSPVSYNRTLERMGNTFERLAHEYKDHFKPFSLKHLDEKDRLEAVRNITEFWRLEWGP